MTASIGGTQQGPATHILRINQVIETQWASYQSQRDQGQKAFFSATKQ
jgi:hypothetical protein